MPDLETNDISATVAYNLIASIELGETLSNFCDVGGMKLCGLFVPADFTGTTLSFKVSPSDSNQAANQGDFTIDDASAYTVQVKAAEEGDQLVYIELPVAKFAGVKYLAILAGTDQEADVDIILACTLV